MQWFCRVFIKDICDIHVQASSSSLSHSKLRVCHDSKCLYATFMKFYNAFNKNIYKSYSFIHFSCTEFLFPISKISITFNEIVVMHTIYPIPILSRFLPNRLTSLHHHTTNPGDSYRHFFATDCTYK